MSSNSSFLVLVLEAPPFYLKDMKCASNISESFSPSSIPRLTQFGLHRASKNLGFCLSSNYVTLKRLAHHQEHLRCKTTIIFCPWKAQRSSSLDLIHFWRRELEQRDSSLSPINSSQSETGFKLYGIEIINHSPLCGGFLFRWYQLGHRWIDTGYGLIPSIFRSSRQKGEHRWQWTFSSS